VGIIGTGRISDLHAIEYRRNPHTRIVALCDRDRELAAARSHAWEVQGALVTTDYHELLAQESVDLVEILLPHHLHAEAALAALVAGKAVSLQKPMTTTLADADRLIAAAEQAAVPFRVFENFIFYPPVVRAKELVDAGAIGTPLTIRIKSNPGSRKFAWAVPAAAQAWRQDRSQAGGGPLVFDDGHHKFALAWHFMGPPEEVHAWIGTTVGEGGFAFDAPAMVSFRFAGQRLGNLEVVYSPDLAIDTKHYAQDDRVEITGTEGVILINRGHGQLGDVVPVQHYRDGRWTDYRDLETGWERSFVHATRHAVDALRAGTQPLLSGRDAREVLRFALAAEASARHGKPVRVEELDEADR
jgi:predicted dehydrogenase